MTARAIPLVAGEASVERLGRLDWRGGLELGSPDARFGGLSGLAVGADGAELLAVTDRGHWFGARLVYDQGGRLTGLRNAWLAPLLDADGTALKWKVEADAEELLALAGGGYLVAFERRHRLWRYDGPEASAADWPAPDLGALPANGGIEALGAFAGGRVLALTEAYFVAPGALAGWLIGGGPTVMVIYPSDGYFKPTGLAVLDGGRALVLERGYTVVRGVQARLMLLGGGIGPGARLELEEVARFAPPVQVDNFEAVAVRRDAEGRALVYIVSDDNFSPLQRTLLMMFALAE